MQTNPDVTRGWQVRHPQFMKARDAEISFDCYLPGVIAVSEIINGEIIHSQIVERHRDVVREMETKYIFFADEADMARKLVRSGHSCVYNVYFREP
jgi:hypothetical protein